MLSCLLSFEFLTVGEQRTGNNVVALAAARCRWRPLCVLMGESVFLFFRKTWRDRNVLSILLFGSEFRSVAHALRASWNLCFLPHLLLVCFVTCAWIIVPCVFSLFRFFCCFSVDVSTGHHTPFGQFIQLCDLFFLLCRFPPADNRSLMNCARSYFIRSVSNPLTSTTTVTCCWSTPPPLSHHDCMSRRSFSFSFYETFFFFSFPFQDTRGQTFDFQPTIKYI